MHSDDQDAPTRIPPEKNRGGVWITFGGEQYRVPALGFRAIQDMQDTIATMGSIAGMPTREQLAAIVEIVHGAIKRNYPSMTAEQVLEMIDMSNFRSTLDAVFAVSGFVRRAQGEGGSNASGEATASTGASSTPS